MTEFIQICLGGLVVGSVYGLIALGFSLVYRVSGAINLSQGGFSLLAALTAYTFGHSWGWPLPIAILAAIVTTVITGLIVGRLTFVPAVSRLSNANVLMLSVGLLTTIEGASLVIWGSQPYALPSFGGPDVATIGFLRVPTQAFWVAGSAFVVVLVAWYFLAFTRLGRGLRACAENPLAASLMGIRVPQLLLLSFTMAALVAGVAGVVIAPMTTLQFDTGRLFTILGFIAAVLGGLSSLGGAMIGGLALGLVQQLATAYVSSIFSGSITLFILLIVLIWRPNGLVSPTTVRRQDVRDETHVSSHVVHLSSSARWLFGISLFVVALGLPLFVQDRGLMSGLVIAGILFIALMGLDVIMGYAGQVNLGQAGFMATGGYTAGYLAVTYAVSPILATVAGIFLSAVCALILSAVTLRLRGLYLALATLAFGLLVDSLTVGLVDITGGPSGLVGIPPFSLGSVEFSSPRSMYYLVLAVIVICFLGLAGAMRGGFGRALKAIRTDQLAAAALGINVVRYKVIAFVVSASLAGLSGSLYAFFFNFLSPEMVGTSRSLELVAMLVIGGEGTLIGGLLGSVLITLLPIAFQAFAIYQTLATGLLLVGCFLHLPQGLLGGLSLLLSRLPFSRSMTRTLAAVETT
jgi:branched-chain amino acid transport system permease protein